MSPTTKVLGGAMLLTATICGTLPSVRDYLGNSFKLWQLERALASTDHAPGTRFLGQEGRVGLLMGTKDCCEYFVGQLRSYSGLRGDVLRHYRRARVVNPVSEKREGVDVLFLDGDTIPAGCIPPELQDLSAWGVTEGRAGTPMYLVYVFRSYPANADLRCR